MVMNYMVVTKIQSENSYKIFQSFAQRAFIKAVENRRRISWRLANTLKSIAEIMPPELCQSLGLEPGSDFSSGSAAWTEAHGFWNGSFTRSSNQSLDGFESRIDIRTGYLKFKAREKT